MKLIPREKDSKDDGVELFMADKTACVKSSKQLEVTEKRTKIIGCSSTQFG